MQGTSLTINQQLPVRHPYDEAQAGVAASLYIHVPFCFHKCHYCDFYSFVDRQDRQGEFVECLRLELSAMAELAAKPLRTIFVGGGTPTLLSPHLWMQLLGCLHELFTIGAGTEFTVECNPETATAELMDVLVSGGVNRVSIGAQSFDERHLKTLERWHDPASVERAIGLAQAAGIGRQSVDLISAIPGQTVDEAVEDVSRALELGVGHVSVYTLTYEPRTEMTARLERGEFEPASEEIEAEMFEAVGQVMVSAGLGRYEVSNFAKPGEECRHNLAYWRNEGWLAAGPSASAHLGGQRWKSIASLREWMKSVRDSNGRSAIVDHETADPRRALAEQIMMGIRLAEGIRLRPLLKQASVLGCESELRSAIDVQIDDGRLEQSAERLSVTNQGWLFVDGIAAELMEAIQ